ncbi:MAG: ribonuclease [Firmicutes bacterium]|nr:ribonuclease [Bacillota bacterium]
MGCKKKEPPQAPTVDQEGTEEPHEPKSDPEQEAESEPEPGSDPEQEAESEPEEAELIAEDGWYYSKDDVALYIYTYGHLPDNYITKKEAKKLGWTGGSVEKFAEGMAIGGDRFGNYEGNLPDKKGRTYWECDIDTNGAKNRGAKRIIFSSDGLIFYTGDHYETFELLYGEEVR